MNMKHGVIIKDKAATLILMIVFIFFIIVIVACATTPQVKKVWTKPQFTRHEFARDKYECMQQSQQNYAYSEGGFYIGSVYVPSEAKSRVITNWNLFNACMEARDWRLIEQPQ